ncbi:hypothetical protein EFP18_09275 [Burkholderia glumae]|uniref:hypothetical protein n=1 Tax=Burkholderia glumae TaxID=337 RepID=UPI000C273214|nr:hypothetical protein [Burkholderia glumae]MCQ0033513.1 hypothetical protein [Burkholderia glumae]MCQ0039301.1 hypothetical protein [Burkholderia glumae]MCR1767312.1 hypothetical protein [Burkholderia glumae]PJO22640.1 hypothetical protein Y5A_013410 [Burkholderia glumae AU6208]QHE12986.1 hypothetical protein GQR88_22080 [Burkholderia glumae AU6208]
MPASAVLAQACPVTDLIALGVLALIYVCALGWAGWQSLRARRGRLHWVICVALLVAGALAMAIARPATPDSGAMPGGFALGLLVALAGLAATAAGCARQALGKLRDPRR